MRLSLLISLLTAALLGGAAAPALADTVTSSNWAGYSVHRDGVMFKRVSASWIQPNATCVAGNQTYSAVWVGLGGYNQSSNALEQIGSEIDCTAAGKVESSVWYELVPAASQTIKLRVRPHDALSASVTVTGSKVVLSITDTTTHHSFTKTLHASTVDVSSAEWIVEAPSDCISDNACQTLPLANFGSATFTSASATSLANHTGSISDHAWDSSKIQLTADGRRFIVYNGGSTAVGIATPSTLNSRGRSFKVIYSTTSVQQPPVSTASRRASAALAGRLIHPGR